MRLSLPKLFVKLDWDVEVTVFFFAPREEEGRRRVRMLRQQLESVKREKEVELQQRNEMIAHLKDQLQVNGIN